MRAKGIQVPSKLENMGSNCRPMSMSTPQYAQPTRACIAITAAL
jgi:hypothetical protein